MQLKDLENKVTDFKILSYNKDLKPKEREIFLLVADFLSDISKLLFTPSGKWIGPIHITHFRRIWLMAKIAFRLAKLLIVR